MMMEIEDDQNNNNNIDNGLDELIFMDEAEQAERENRMAGDEDADMIEEQKLQEEEIERQISVLAQQKSNEQNVISPHQLALIGLP